MKKKLLVMILSCLVGISSVPQVAFASSVDEAGQKQEVADSQTEEDIVYLEYLKEMPDEEGEPGLCVLSEEDIYEAHQEEGYYLSEESKAAIEDLGVGGLEARDSDVPEAIEGDFTYQVVDGKAYLVSYDGEDEDIVVPSTLGGYPLEGINQGAFREKHNLKSITFSEGIKSMGGEGIFRCENLESVYFPSTFMSGMNSNIRGLGGMIVYCDKLSTITVSEDNENLCVYDGALYTQDMKTLLLYPSADQREIFQIPDGVETIGDDSCRNDYVKEVIMPDTVTFIGYWAFCNASSLEKINISGNCEMIGQFAIQGTQITALNIPASVTGIARSAINGNSKLEEITVDENNPVYHSHEGVLCSETSVCAYPLAKTAECYEVENGISYIDMSAFYGAKNLKKVVLPNTMQGIDTYAFFNCYNLEEINLPNGISYMGSHIFANDSKLKNIILPYSMKEIPESVLLNVTSATVQENVKQIQEQSFFNYLQEIYFAGDIPQKIENIVSVEEDRKLTIYYPYGNATWEDAIAEYSNSNITWLPHTHSISDEWVEDWPAACDRAGQNSQHCTVCGAVAKAQIIEALGHPETEVRNAKEASCTESGYTGDTYCVVCNEKLESGSEISENGHQWDEGRVMTEASCTESGKISYTCIECKETKEEVIEAKGHGEREVRNAKEASCTESGYTGDTYCVVCNEKLESGSEIPEKGHQWDEGKVTKKVTYAGEGIKLYTCSVCGGTREESIDMLELAQPQISNAENADKGVSVKWNKVQGAAGYRIYRKSGKGTWNQIAQVKSGSSTTYIDTKAKDGTTYVYTVSAYNGKNESTYSQKGKSVIRLKAPKISQLKNKTAKLFLVKWTKNSKVNGYQIQYSTSSQFKKGKNISVSANTVSKTVKKLSKGKKYYVRVRAYKKIGKDEYYSAWSGVKSVKIKK